MTIQRTYCLSVLLAAVGVTAPAWAIHFTPTQADLFNVTDVTDDFSGGGSLFAASNDGDGVLYDMDFAPGTDGFSRVVVQNSTPSFTDLSAFDSFDLLFEAQSIPLSVKTYINTGESGFFESPLITIPTGSDDRIVLPLAGLPDLNDVRGFGIQMFDPEDGTAFQILGKATPAVLAPPQIVTTPLASFETGFENWAGSFQGDISHAIDTAHASEGSQSLRLNRTNNNADFSWGTEFYLNAGAADGLDPAIAVPDPDSGRLAVNATQQEVDDFAALFDGATSIAFDVIIDPATIDPAVTYTSYIVFLNDGVGGFWSVNSSIGVDPTTAGTTTLAFDLDSFESKGTGLPVGTPFDGFSPGTEIVRVGIGTGIDGTGSVFIDNVRLLTEVFGGDGIPGDYNDSGLVEQGDLDQVLANWGQGFAGLPGTWVNQRPTEGIVDQAELDVVLQEWGSSAAPNFAGSTVPEPAAALALGGVLLTAGRRNRAR